MKVSLQGLYRFIQLKTGDVTYLELNQIPDPEERLYIMQLLMRLGTNLRSESDLARIEHLLEEIARDRNVGALDALERLVMLL
ncbi:MAG: hypothetical protein ACO2PL_20755 [Armatimonadota bacterium]|jgi:hypothetical protein